MDIKTMEKVVDLIHEATEKVLEEKGILIPDEKALKIFKEKGAKVEGQLVYISKEMLEATLKTVPSSFTIRGRNPENSVEIGNGKPCFASSGGSSYVKKGSEHRPSEKEDLINFFKLVETSSVIDAVSYLATTASDIPGGEQTARQLALALEYSTKPIVGATAGYDVSVKSIEMLQEFYDDYEENVCIGIMSPITPLSYDLNMLGGIIGYAEKNQPMIIASAVLPGVTAPAPAIGGLIIANAEVLAGVVLAQLVRPGVPVVYGNASGGSDLRYGTPAIGSSEAALTVKFTRMLADKYGFPCRSGGALSDSKTYDGQAGIESTLVMSESVSQGIDFVFHSAGVLDSYNTICYEKFLMDEEMIGMCKRANEQIDISDKALDLEPIMDVKHGESFMTLKKTFKYVRSNPVVTPKYFAKGYYGTWEKDGAKEAATIALEQLEERLRTYEKVPLTEDQRACLEKYVENNINV